MVNGIDGKRGLHAWAVYSVALLVRKNYGAGTEQYPLIDSCCAQVTACAIRTRTRYATIVKTNATGGSFKLLNKTCALTNSLASINGGAE